MAVIKMIVSSVLIASFIGISTAEQSEVPIGLFDSQADVFALPNGEIPEVPIDEGNGEEDENAFILSTSKPLGQVAGLGIDSTGNLIAFHRADREWNEDTFTKDFKLNKALGVIPNATIAVIDPNNGKVSAEFGENLFYLPHGLTIDHEDNVWVTDVGSHQVHKLDKNFKPVMSFGEKMMPGSDEKHFCKPTDVAVAKNGHFFVADGYCNSRVLKFDSKGNLIDIIGSEMDPFIIPHSLSLIEDLNLLCVADRENERVQCFSAGLKEGHRSIPAGIPITSADNIGRVFAIRERKHFLVGVTGSDAEEAVESQVFVIDIESGKAQTFLKGIENGHAIAISPEGTLFVAQINPNQIVSMNLN
ncbi:unnamed protein product, partial [Mesorhabditis belari]|uniref:peptidylamidoglycolate lyase n=1 Tax=Mesorhabditis belari TaxID=2138241 RepID=A0AAF3F3L7_9BILA